MVPVNPRCESILGERSHKALQDIAFPVDRVDVVRRSEDVLPFAQGAVEIGAKCLRQQIGVKNLEADALARAAGLDAVMDRWVKIDAGPVQPTEQPRMLGRGAVRRPLGRSADGLREAHRGGEPARSRAAHGVALAVSGADLWGLPSAAYLRAANCTPPYYVGCPEDFGQWVIDNIH